MKSIVRLRILLLDILYFHVTLFAVPHVSIFTRLQMMKAVEFLYLSTFWAPFHPRNHGFSFLSEVLQTSPWQQSSILL